MHFVARGQEALMPTTGSTASSNTLIRAVRRLREFVMVLVRPSYWVMNYPYSEEWDTELRWLLDSGYTFEDVNEHHARIGDYEVWIANHPYASFTVQGDIRPSRVTIMRARRVLMAGRFERRRFRPITSANRYYPSTRH